MEMMLFRRDEWNELYNCTWYRVDSLPIEMRQHKVAGSLAIAMTVLFELLYIPCFCVIIRPEYIRHSCFKFMAVLGFLDITLLPFSGFLSGLYAIRGDMYCSYPTFIYSYSVVVNSLWGSYMVTCLILAVNRCTMILNPQLAKRLFDGRRTFAWLLIPAAASIAMLYFQPLIYNGVVFAWVANPHIGYLQDDGTKVLMIGWRVLGLICNALTGLPYGRPNGYHNHLHIVTNLSAAIGLPIVYAVFIFILLWKTSGIQTLTKHREFSTFAQVLYIAGLTMTVGVTYVYFQFFTAPPIVIVLANLGWLCIQGSPAIVYLTLNKSIRRDVLDTFSILAIKVYPSSPSSNAKSGNSMEIISSHDSNR